MSFQRRFNKKINMKKNNNYWKLKVHELNVKRVQINLSMKKVAENADVDPRHISRFFSCKTEPLLSTFLKIEKAVNLI